MAYVPNPTDANQPLDSVFASTAAAEFRALKAYVQTIVSTGGLGVATPGQVVLFPAGSVAPAGWLELNGVLVSRTTFATLWAAIQAFGTTVSEAVWSAGNIGLFSTGDLSTTFRLADLRGVFVRGWNHGKTGAQFDAGRGLGDTQLGTLIYDNFGNSGSVGVLPLTGQMADYGENGIGQANRNYNTVAVSGTGSAATQGITVKPINTTMMYCIKT